MAADLLWHPCSGRACALCVPDSERELKSLKISLKIFPLTPLKRCIYRHFRWRRGSESDEEASPLRLQLTLLQGLEYADFRDVQALFPTARSPLHHCSSNALSQLLR